MKPLITRFVLCAGLAATLAVGGCADDGSAAEGEGESDGHDDHDHDDDGHDDHGHDHGETEIITRVALTFVPQGGGDTVTAAFSDPDGDGGASGMADPITLAVGTTYDLSVSFTNELVEPAEDITAEIEEEAEAHQLFFVGDAVSGPAAGMPTTALVTHSYADMESTYGPNEEGDDLPVGLANTIETTSAGTGTLTVRLQHLPELNGTPQKVAGLAEQLAMDEPLPGDVDARVGFDLTVE